MRKREKASGNRRKHAAAAAAAAACMADGPCTAPHFVGQQERRDLLDGQCACVAATHMMCARKTVGA